MALPSVRLKHTVGAFADRRSPGTQLGGGTPFLPPMAEAVRLDLLETRTFGFRVIYERYGRARDESGLGPG